MLQTKIFFFFFYPKTLQLVQNLPNFKIWRKNRTLPCTEEFLIVSGQNKASLQLPILTLNFFGILKALDFGLLVFMKV